MLSFLEDEPHQLEVIKKLEEDVKGQDLPSKKGVVEHKIDEVNHLTQHIES
jgi:hypothetical protein